MTKTTCLPWSVRPGVYDSSPEASEFPHGPEVIDAASETRAFLNLNDEEGAELIVRAVNSHAALVEALTEYVERHEAASPNGESLRGLPEYEMALAALTLAKGA